ncbi:RHS repeat domain-containing protein [Aquimarina brevivitae]|uniref:YD repeat-containing protein n=1 Tax=Aquimarina brevivitae TaxID=323412 RepID=A0A4Q7NTW5_9FLAO|nr:RHS repeat domain-containing protein [Aquimarina brevivitae]RZS90545.1 hypothetical protein EV197_3339 [Aquimarina brevivitae]
MKRLIYFCFVVIISSTNLIYGQINENNRPGIMPSSPTAFEFLKYGEVPVSKYTGVPNINIPIYTIKAKGMDFPINLSYHSNGFRVDEEAGWTGLGWTLNTGGNIVQIINGYDDFGPYKNRQFIDIDEIADVVSDGSAPGGILDSCNGTYIGIDDYYFNLPGNSRRCGRPEGSSSVVPPGIFGAEQLDFEPDVFKFNALGYSGTFVLDWETETFKCLTDPRIKITKSQNSHSEITIILPEGHHLVFSVKEETTMLKGDIPYISEYYQDLYTIRTSRVYKLDHIFTSHNDHLEFFYTITETVKNYVNRTDVTISYENSGSGSGNLGAAGLAASSGGSAIVTEQPFSYLNKIKFNGGVILFNSSERLDLARSRKLDNITIKENETSNKIFKKFDFHFSYFIGHTNGNYDDNNYDYIAPNLTKPLQERTHRLKLDSLTDSTKPSYSFTYNTEPLPQKTSYAKDYWGYYNGKLNNSSLFVDLSRFNYAITTSNGNNRSAVESYCKSGILERIKYPTGGYTQFDYELNSFNNYYVPNADDDPIFKEVLIQVGTPNGNPNTRSQMAEIFETTPSLEGNYLLSTRGCTNLGNYEAYADTYIRIDYYDDAITEEVANDPYGYMHALSGKEQYIVDTEYIQMTATDPEEVLNNSFSYSLKKAGVVKFTAVGGCGTYNGTTNSSGAWMTLQGNIVVNATEEPDSNSYGAGLRIKNIKHFNFDNQLLSQKTYSYKDGKLMTPLRFYNKSYISAYDYPSYDESGNFIGAYRAIGFRKKETTSSFVIPSTNASGNFVGYNEVSESFVSNNDENKFNGKITGRYENHIDDGIFPLELNNVIDNNDWYSNGHFTELNLPTREKNDIKNGSLLEELIFDKNNILKKKTINTYTSELNNFCVNGVKVGPVIERANCGAWQHTNPTYTQKYLLGVYPIRGIYTKLVNTTNINYFDNNEITSSEQFIYDSNLQLKEKRSTTSEGNEIIEYFKYPMSSNSNYFTNLLEYKVENNNQTVQDVDYTYSPITSVGLHHTAYLLGSETDQIQDIATFYNYDNQGSIKSTYQRNNALKTYYIWDYYNKYPVAKVETVQTTGIPTAIENDIINASIDMESQALQNAFTDLRQAMPNAMITTYTYENLVGVKSITDTRGNTTTYHYDEHNRLEFVKDKDGKLISENKYNYKN